MRCFLFLILSMTQLWAQEAIHITSNGPMTCSEAKRRCTARDHVRAQFQEGDLQAEDLIVHFSPTAPGHKKMMVRRFTATGKPLMTWRDKKATGETATYDAKKDCFILEGSPMLRDPNWHLSTPRKIVVYKGKNRAHARMVTFLFFSKKIVLKSNKATLFFTSSFKPASDNFGDLERVLLKGHCLLIMEDGTLMAEHINFKAQTQEIFLEGDVRLVYKGNLLRGARGYVDRDKRVTLSSEKGNVAGYTQFNPTKKDFKT